MKLIYMRAEAARHVAPFVGAWVETTDVSGMLVGGTVAPFVGAWVETAAASHTAAAAKVAPFVGAWVETTHPSARKVATCRALRGRVG